MNKNLKENSIHDEKELENYLVLKAKNHNHFKYYAKFDYIKTILDTNAVFLSNGEKWNDKMDYENFANSDKSCCKYALCLSYSKSESVAMWLLYSGNNGCMIDYSKKIIFDILNAEYLTLGNFENGVFIEKERLNKSDFEIELTDILYYGEAKNKSEYYVKRSDETNKAFSKTIVDKMSAKKKKLSWSYENECIIIVSIESNIIKGKYSNLKIDLPKERNEVLLSRTYDSPNCKEKKYNDSSLKKDMNWNLCKGCTMTKQSMN